jgi:4-hydroxythreonine-4-phosphate dehydrogenase
VVQDNRPILGLTIGDPSGVGPEITVKAAMNAALQEKCRMIVIGDAGIVGDALSFSGLSARINKITDPADGVYSLGTINLLDLGNVDFAALKMGTISRESGAAALAYIETGVDLALAGHLHGIVTAPIHKEAIHLAGCPLAGHTDIIAHRTKTEIATSMMCVGSFRVLHVTLHVSMADVAQNLTRERVLRIIGLADSATRELGIESPRIGVAGFNPHSSDGGLFGNEEANIILPAIEDAREQGMNVNGPVPPDSMFMKLRGGAWDVCVAMYHDQGHIPVKMMGWYWDESQRTWTKMSGVAVTLGLPIIRTNPDHGTAFEIAGKGIATPQAMCEAIEVAVDMAHGQGRI